MPNKMPPSYFVDANKVIIKLMWEKKDLDSQHYIEKEESWKMDDLQIQDFLQSCRNHDWWSDVTVDAV